MSNQQFYMVPQDLVINIINYLRTQRPMSEVEDAVVALRKCQLVTPQTEDNGEHQPGDQSAAELRS